MATAAHSEPEHFHPVADRVLYVGNVPLTTTSDELAACFDICLGKGSLAFLQYPYDAQAKCHKGFAFVMLNRNRDVATCLSKRNRSWFYVEGKPSAGGFDSRGRAYLRIRSARVEGCTRKEEPTHLIFTPASESAEAGIPSVGMREFKSKIEEVVHALDVETSSIEGILDGKHKYVHVHTVDAESAAVVKMFMHNFKENDILMSVRFGRKPKVAAKNANDIADAATAKAAAAPRANEKPLVLEPITELYGKFGVSYAQVVSAAHTSTTPTAPKAAQAAPSSSKTPTKAAPSTNNGAASVVALTRGAKKAGTRAAQAPRNQLAGTA